MSYSHEYKVPGAAMRTLYHTCTGNDWIHFKIKNITYASKFKLQEFALKITP